jgi:hypothetical protein
MTAQNFDPLIPATLTISPTYASNVMSAYEHSGAEVVRIQGDGRLFWRGREVFTDDAFRSAILELVQIMSGKHGGS